MAECHYHPEKKGTGKCPNCNQFICDRCRINGTETRCATCQNAFKKGTADGKKTSRVYCLQHKETVADKRCLICKRPYCVACVNSQGHCQRCVKKLLSVSEGGQRPLTVGEKTRAFFSHPYVQLGIASLVVVGLVYVVWVSKNRKPEVEKAYVGKASVSVVSPRSGGVVRGNVVIAVQVAPADKLDNVEIRIDGKHWATLKSAPFESEWPTAIFRNGVHRITARAVFKGRKRVAEDACVCRVQK